MVNRLFRGLAFCGAASAIVALLTQPPIKLINAPIATSSIPLGTIVSVRELSDGRVLVNDVGAKRLVIFDSLLVDQELVYADSSAGSSEFGTMLKATSLIGYLGDSTLYCDLATGSILVLDGAGRLARVIALPHPRDLNFLAFDILYGPPQVDSLGRVTYRGAFPPPAQGISTIERTTLPVVRQADSAVIVRVDFEKRTTDTLASVKTQQVVTNRLESVGVRRTLITEIDPLAAGDQWTMLRDGTIAIVRGHDYHIDWIDSDGSKRSTPKMPFDWRRVSAARKQVLFDSIADVYAKRNAQSEGRATGRSLITVYRPIPVQKMSDYEPALGLSAVLAGPNNTVWVLPRSSLSARSGLLYDVITRDGLISYRVQLSSATKIVGFGANGSIYLLHVVGTQGFLQRVGAP